jgi:hypothetical protein
MYRLACTDSLLGPMPSRQTVSTVLCPLIEMNRPCCCNHTFEKVRGPSDKRNNRIINDDLLHRTCALDARLESILLRDPPQNPFFNSIDPERT